MLIRLHRRWRSGRVVSECGERQTLRVDLSGRAALVSTYHGIPDRVILPVDGNIAEHKGGES